MWLWGVLCCVGGSFNVSFGLILQKYSHSKARGWGGGTVVYLQLWWVIGFSIYCSGQILNLVAMAWTPQAMLSALGASSLLFIWILAWAVLGESMRPLELFASIWVVVGVVMVILAMPHPAEDGARHAVHRVAGSLGKMEFLITAAVFVGSLLAGRAAVVLMMPDFAPAHAVFWALLTGILAGYTFTLSKCIAMLVMGARHAWGHWQLYVIVLLVFGMCVLQVHTMNLALAMGYAKAVLPLTFVLGVMIQILNAQVAFEELSVMTRHATFWVGMLLVLVSIVAIVQLQLTGEEEAEQLIEEDKELPEECREALAGPERGRSHTMTPLGLTALHRAKHPRRNSSYFGVSQAAGWKGKIFPMAGGGLVVVA